MKIWIFYVLLWLASAAAWAKATRANLRSSLIYSVIWGWIAWAALTAAFLSQSPGSLYAALALTGCAGIAVLGARRPGAAAWQFVVVGLLCVTLLPFAESVLRDRPLVLSPVRWIFLIGLLALTIANYIRTSFGFAALLIGAAEALAIVPAFGLAEDGGGTAWLVGAACTCTAPLVGWICVRRRSDMTSFDRLWLDFRDRFGAIWSLRVIEQFNRSAANAGSSARLSWRGLRGPENPDDYARLMALMTRFGLPADQKLGPAGPPPPPP